MAIHCVYAGSGPAYGVDAIMMRVISLLIVTAISIAIAMAAQHIVVTLFIQIAGALHSALPPS